MDCMIDAETMKSLFDFCKQKKIVLEMISSNISDMMEKIKSFKPGELKAIVLTDNVFRDVLASEFQISQNINVVVIGNHQGEEHGASVIDSGNFNFINRLYSRFVQVVS